MTRGNGSATSWWHCNTLQHIEAHCNSLVYSRRAEMCVLNSLQHTATHRNTPKHTATALYILHTATVPYILAAHCNSPIYSRHVETCVLDSLQHTATVPYILAAHCNSPIYSRHAETCVLDSLQHTATHCNTPKHTATALYTLDVQRRVC